MHKYVALAAGPTPALRDAARPHCHPITHRLAHHHAHSGTLFVTFTNAEVSEFAVNWARRLHEIRLSGVVGTADFLLPRHAEALRAAGVGIFCASSDQMKRNGQAGRWTEVAPVCSASRL